MDEQAESRRPMILVKNIYYMLAYAFTSLQSKGYREMSSERFDDFLDRFKSGGKKKRGRPNHCMGFR